MEDLGIDKNKTVFVKEKLKSPGAKTNPNPKTRKKKDPERKSSKTQTGRHRGGQSTSDTYNKEHGEKHGHHTVNCNELTKN